MSAVTVGNPRPPFFINAPIGAPIIKKINAENAVTNLSSRHILCRLITFSLIKKTFF
jgi:hypothetical protein